MRNKVKLTEQEAQEFTAFIKYHVNEGLSTLGIIRCFMDKKFNYKSYNLVKEMDLEKFILCFTNGYEIIKPPTPRLVTNKVYVSFNNCIYNLPKDREIFLRVTKICDAFSIKEASEIAHVLNSLVEYYNKHIEVQK